MDLVSLHETLILFVGLRLLNCLLLACSVNNLRGHAYSVANGTLGAVVKWFGDDIVPCFLCSGRPMTPNDAQWLPNDAQ